MPKNRRKADGAEFEREFKDAMDDAFYVLRLPTLNTGFSGLRQPADFVLVGNNFNYVELKETAKTRFSITTMEQLDKVQEFRQDRARLNKPEMEYWLVVHFLTEGVYKVLRCDEILKLADEHKSLAHDAKIGKSYSSLNDLKEVAF